MKPTILMLGTLVLAVLIGSCTLEPIEPAASGSFSSVEELRGYLAGTSTDRTGMMLGTDELIIAEAADGAVRAMPASAPTYTDTNVQVEGVDEADILKTDGNHLYTIVGRSVAIIKTLPSNETEQIASIAFDWNPHGLFLKDDLLYVIGSEWDTRTYTIVVGYDVTDPTTPERVFESRIEGSYVTGRSTDRVYVVSQSAPDYLRPMPMPIIHEAGVERTVDIGRIMLPRPVDNARFVTISEIQPDGAIDATSVISEGYPTVYASERAIHLAMGRQINQWTIRQEQMRTAMEPHLTADDGDLIRRIEATDEDILSHSEKRMRIDRVISHRLASFERSERERIQDLVERNVKEELERHESFEYTNLIEVPYATLRASEPVEIRGTVNNQFSLDEHDGVLRVATTTNPRWSLGEGVNDMANHVYTIRDGRVLDSVHGLGPGERIYSARYLDDRLYMVTFREVDPFFAIDLSDPERIEVLGELKIPGFSRYLHAYSENMIIGLGRDASETGVQRGLKVSLFDVSDPSRPRELTNWISDERHVHSAAEWEHKAFLLDKRNDLLVIPISGSRNWVQPVIGRDERSTPEQRDGGALIFTIREDSIELRGLVAHPGWSGVERSLVIEDALYTKSPSLLRVNALDDLSTLSEVSLQEDRGIPVY
ncbi:MAG: beta-propeller domain-containing protein [Candidatus Woesearchaeota archaeon]